MKVVFVLFAVILAVVVAYKHNTEYYEFPHSYKQDSHDNGYGNNLGFGLGYGYGRDSYGYGQGYGYGYGH